MIALIQLGIATALFIAAASSGKVWALSPSGLKLTATLLLYTGGNLLLLRRIRHLGTAIAFSLSAVLQLLAVNLVAVLWFGERVGWIEGAGLCLAVLAVALVTLGPRLSH